jgi:hypothetical protein
VDKVLKVELSPLYIGLRDFHKIFFRGVAGFKVAAAVVFKKYIEGSDPLFSSER